MEDMGQRTWGTEDRECETVDRDRVSGRGRDRGRDRDTDRDTDRDRGRGHGVEQGQ